MEFHRDAFAFVMAPLAIDRPTGISMRFDVWMMVKNPAVKPLDPRVLLCLGAAAIVANPAPISRRRFFGLGVFGGRRR